MSKKSTESANEIDSFFEWLASYRAMREDAWEHIPSIGLYMDQVVGYLNEALSPTAKKKEEATLTASMVNNYVKFGYLSRPEKKRYTREQIAVLYLLCSMKQSLSMTEASALVSLLTEGANSEKLASLYTRFTEERQRTADSVAARAAAGTREELIENALSFVLEAEALRLVAARILSHVTEADKAAEEARAAAALLAEEEDKKAAKAAKKQ